MITHTIQSAQLDVYNVNKRETNHSLSARLKMDPPYLLTVEEPGVWEARLGLDTSEPILPSKHTVDI